MKEMPPLFGDALEDAGKDDRPRLAPRGDLLVPEAPLNVGDTGLTLEVLSDLALKLAHRTYTFTTEWSAQLLNLPVQLTEELLRQLAHERMLEILGQVTPFTHRYTITERGLERTKRLLEISGYIGPAPVSLGDYRTMIEAQIDAFPPIQPAHVAAALADLELDEVTMQIAGVALTSGRSLFLFGPPGNGKTSLGRRLHKALQGEIWIPYAISIDNEIIRLFDPLCHEPSSLPDEGLASFDRRWIRIRRPLIVTGGELSVTSLDLSYSPSMRYYEAPLHMKANGGVLFIDDFGRQRIEPHELLNRWIVPLEYRIDHLTLRTGQQIPIPFRQFLIVATNLDPREVTDSAFLRRMGYRLHLDNPSPQRYAKIFERCAARIGLSSTKGILEHLLERYHDTGREQRCSHPQDLLDRVVDTCRYRNEAPALNQQLLDLVWEAHFGRLGM